MPVPKLEKLIGIEVYATSSAGIGGTIRQDVEDFVVEELLVDGSKARIDASGENHAKEALGSSLTRNRYLLCILVKRNWDTFIALRNVANQLGVSTSQIQIAGIKDAKAITAQHVTLENIAIDEIQKIQIKDIEVRPVGYLRHKLSSYYLMGNNFQIRIKAVNHSRQTITQRIAGTIRELETIGGVPNFFGHQRFGTTRPITHLVGKAIVKGNFRKAVMLFLAKPSPFEHSASRQAREELRATQDFKQASKNFPRQLRYERLMLMPLAQKPDDFVGAFRRLPIKLRELFVQAYQAYLFNKFLSKRIKSGYPLNAAEVGDYVVNVERSGLPLSTMHRTADMQKLLDINNSIETGKMRLALPLVGFRQQPSEGIQGQIENQILEEEGVRPQNFKTKTVPEMSAKGGLRVVITPMIDFSLEKVREEPDEPARHCAEINFALHRSSYATVVLRELMKSRNPIEAGF